MNRWLVGLCGACVVLSLACHDDKREQAPRVTQGPIVNGDLESGYDQVGALTAWFGNQYGGAFCTGTLIRSDWVLTAAHCLEDASVAGTRFYVGDNANNPNSGDFYRALEFKIHEQYDPNRLENDIALVRLQSPVPGLTPIAYSTANLSPHQGEEAFYVGFGATEGINESGSGVKRSTSFPISAVFAGVFISDYQGTGTCFGDSGGPALLTINGNLSVVGVTSAGAACEGPGCDPCQTSTTSTRVDSYSPWIAGKLDDPPPDCRQNAAICSCANACQPDGTCNDDVCQTASCGDAYTCIANCGADAGCQEQCFNNTTPEAQQQMDALFQCLDANCSADLSESEYAQCAQSKCAEEVQACFGGTSVTGNETCEQVYDCFGACQDEACYQTCFEQGTADAQVQMNTMLNCFDAQCGTITDETQWVTCVQDKCGDEITGCFGEAESCDLMGGSCAAGTACYPTTTDGFNGCFDTAGKPVGGACDPNATDLECVDGSACVGLEAGGGTCERFCASDAVCGADAVCDFDITGVTGVGLCGAAGEEPVCTDNDHDGSCLPDDCNDGSPAVHPGGTEQCGNGADDNCNGQVDEGCSTSCTDTDADGFCVENDCNDGDPTVHPNGSERCGDATDNNCNNQVDENCNSCTDADHDGFCADQDCNDNNVGAHPMQAETCNNGVDDNCNGQIDENCGTTTDPNNPPAQGGNSNDGCAGGGVSWLALLGLLVVFRRARLLA